MQTSYSYLELTSAPFLYFFTEGVLWKEICLWLYIVSLSWILALMMIYATECRLAISYLGVVGRTTAVIEKNIVGEHNVPFQVLCT